MSVKLKCILIYRGSHPRQSHPLAISLELPLGNHSVCCRLPPSACPRQVLPSRPSNAAAFAHPLCSRSCLAAVHMIIVIMMITPATTPDGATFFVEADRLCRRLSPATLLLQLREGQHNWGACQLSPGWSFHNRHATPHAFRAEDIS